MSVEESSSSIAAQPQESIDEWMVRTSDCLLAGPYTADQIKGLVEEGHLTSQDETCPGNGYWFFLHEDKEVQSYLKIDALPLPVDPDAEITEIDTDGATLTNISDNDPAPPKEDSIPDIHRFEDEETAVLRNQALRRFQPGTPNPEAPVPQAASKPTPSNPQMPETLGQVESRPSFWRYLAMILLLVILFLVVTIWMITGDS